MNNSQTLEIKIKSTAQEAISNINKLTDEVFKLGNTIQKVTTRLDRDGQVLNRTITTSEKTGKKLYSTIYKIGQDGSIEKITSNVKKLGNSTKKTSSMFEGLGKSLSLVGLYYGVRRLSTTFLTWMNESTDRTEQLNLFNVVFKNIEKNGVKTFSTLGESALKFQNRLNEAFGSNLTDTLKYQALFQSMAENASIPDAYSKIMSETMTKFTYDLASLYNKSESDVAEALRAGVYAGQTKPLRSYGIDVTQSTMKPMLESLGIIDRSVSDLSQGEKEILRYIAALEQAKVAMGDYADTIESPANQMKVFKNLLIESKVAITSLFMGTFAKILPYANALLMVVKEVANAIANIFGIELSDYNSGIASTDDAYSDLSDSIDGATDSLKELKRQTLGFDQINNINENKTKQNTGEVTGGIDQRLLDAIKGYDNGMDKVRMKATEIRDRIMEWLGFTKEIDPLTDKVGWRLDDTNSTMGKLIKSLVDIVKYGKKVITNVLKVIKKDFDNASFGRIIVSIFENIANLLKTISSNKKAQTIIAKLVESFLLFKTVKTILSPLVTIWQSFTSNIESGSNLINKFCNQLKGTNNYILDSDKTMKSYNETVKEHSNVVLNSDKTINKWQTTLNGIKTALGGIGASVVGLYSVHDAIKSIANDGVSAISVFEGIIGSLTTIGGFATIGSIFGPVGTAIGAVAGVVSTLVTGLITWENENDVLGKSIKEINSIVDEYQSSMNNLIESRNKNLSSINTEFGYYESLTEELKDLVDENGKIKTGYEERANVITTILSNALGIEIQIVDGVIQKYDELETSIYDVINAKKAEAVLQAHESEYSKAMTEKKNLQDAYTKSVKETKTAQEEYSESLKEVADYFGLTIEQVEKYYDGTLKIKDTHGELERSLNQLSQASGNKYVQALEYWTKKVKDATSAEKEAGKALDDNQIIIDNYNKALEFMAEKHYDSVLKMYNNTVLFNGKTKSENDKKYKEEIEAIDRHLKDLKSRKDQYSIDEYNSLVEGYNLQKEALKKSKDEANAILKQKTEDAKNETLKNVNEQLKVFKDNEYRFKETANHLMQLYVDGIASGKPISVNTMENLVNGTIQKIKDKKMDAKSAGEYLIDGVNLGIKNQNKQSSVFTTISNFGANLLSTFKLSLKEHSPSKATEQMGMYFLEGFNLGFNDEKLKTLSNIKNFTSKIIDTMDFDYSSLPSDLSLDVNKYIDYGQINGSLNSNINANVNGEIARNIGNYVARAINSRPIQVDINASTDQGTILETAVNGINQKTKQTGVCPIIIPM